MQLQLDQKVALITGSDSGIGRAIAILFAQEGATVVVNYAHNQQKAEEVQQTIEKNNGKVLVLQADVSQYQQAMGLSQQLAPYNITVNNIAPGAIHTPIDADVEADPEKMNALLAEIPLHRMGQPDEVAKLALYLASDAAAYVTGSTYIIDGGLSVFAGAL